MAVDTHPLFSHAMPQPSEAVMDNDSLPQAGTVSDPKKAIRVPADAFHASDSAAHGIPHDNRCVQSSTLLGSHAMPADMEEPREGEGTQLGLMIGNQQNTLMDFALNPSMQRGAGEGNPPQFEASVYDSMMNGDAGNEAFIDKGTNLMAVMTHPEEPREGQAGMEVLSSDENHPEEESHILVGVGVRREA